MPAGHDLRAARRYAAALFRVALNHNQVDEVGENLATVTEAAQSTSQLMTVLRHPRITRDRKKDLLRNIFAGTLRADVESFLSLLVDKDRSSIIPNVLREYNRLSDEHSRVTDAHVVSAVPLTPEQRSALLDRLQKSSGYTVRLQEGVDESILGGLVVRVGDRLIDGSIATQLQTLREQLNKVKVT